MRQARKHDLRLDQGFTLIELVMVIMLTGLVAASLLVFMRPAVDGYVDVRRRAELTDAADTALRRMVREVRSAVPNSIRIPEASCFELVPTVAGGRYRMASDTANDPGSGCPAGTNCSKPLDTAQPVTQFDVMSPLAVWPKAGDWIVVGNQNPNDVYSGATAAQVSAVTIPNAAFGEMRIAVPAKQFPNGYDGGRFNVVAAERQAVFYICANNTLYRLVRAFDPVYPASCPAVAGADILAENVSDCSFSYDPSVGTHQLGFMSMMLELSAGGERIALSHGAHVDNVP